MYRVFLVDDEVVIREGIRNSFPWDESDFTLCGEAPDGEMAFPMIQDLKPDILITDIRMPFMDGLSLSRKVSQTLPWIHIVILSGYDDFKYAQEAISIGVKQYLLKPVSAKKLSETLETVAEKIRREREKQADVSLLMEQLASSAHHAKERIVAQLLEGRCTSALIDEAESLNMHLDARQYLVMQFSEVSKEGKTLLAQMLHRVTEGPESTVCFTTLLDNPVLMLMQPEPGGDSQGDIEDCAYALAGSLMHEIKKLAIPMPSIAIGAPVSQISELPQSLVSSQAILRSIDGLPPRIMGSLDVDLTSKADLMDAAGLPLYEKLNYATHKDGARIAQDYFARLGKTASESLLVLNYMLVDVLLAGTRIIRQSGGDPGQVLPSRLTQQGELMNLSRFPEKALEAAQSIISIALTYRDDHSPNRYGEILQAARNFIEENYQRSDMSLHEVAKRVALSNNHFCTVFSQEMGVTFTEYLTKTRMDKAKQLLVNTALRSSEIAGAVGYNDPHYFSYLFKKHIGVSPTEFRRGDNIDISG